MCFWADGRGRRSTFARLRRTGETLFNRYIGSFFWRYCNHQLAGHCRCPDARQCQTCSTVSLPRRDAAGGRASSQRQKLTTSEYVRDACDANRGPETDPTERVGKRSESARHGHSHVRTRLHSCREGRPRHQRRPSRPSWQMACGPGDLVPVPARPHAHHIGTIAYTSCKTI